MLLARQILLQRRWCQTEIHPVCVAPARTRDAVRHEYCDLERTAYRLLANLHCALVVDVAPVVCDWRERPLHEHAYLAHTLFDLCLAAGEVIACDW